MSFNLKIDSFWPNSSGIVGGALLYINGSRFSPTTMVLLGDENCKIASLSYSLLTCIIPAQVIRVFISFINIFRNKSFVFFLKLSQPILTNLLM